MPTDHCSIVHGRRPPEEEELETPLDGTPATGHCSNAKVLVRACVRTRVQIAEINAAQ
jgi:hypothetical protein